jgi:hypothetical protein
MAKRSERPERSTALALSSAADDKKPRGMPRVPKSKAAVLQRLCTVRAEGLSLQTMTNRFNTEGGPTLSGKGRWRKHAIGNLLA